MAKKRLSSLMISFHVVLMESLALLLAVMVNSGWACSRKLGRSCMEHMHELRVVFHALRPVTSWVYLQRVINTMALKAQSNSLICFSQLTNVTLRWWQLVMVKVKTVMMRVSFRDMPIPSYRSTNLLIKEKKSSYSSCVTLGVLESGKVTGPITPHFGHQSWRKRSITSTEMMVSFS